MNNPNSPIGVFDSGAGGISVLQELVRELPYENFIFYGDSANAPYGAKTSEEICGRCFAISDQLLHQGVKAIVIACNTATSVAAISLREHYSSIPIIGVEPAIRPASMAEHHRKVLVMATQNTLRLEKYQHLSQKLSTETEFIPLACEGLAKRIEQGNLDAPDVSDLLEKFLAPYIGKVDSIVLGCTHYPFVRKQIQKIMGDLPIYDGGKGTALQLRRRLEAEKMLNSSKEKGTVVFQTSASADHITLYREFFCME